VVRDSSYNARGLRFQRGVVKTTKKPRKISKQTLCYSPLPLRKWPIERERNSLGDKKNANNAKIDGFKMHTVGTESIRTAERISMENAFFKTLPKIEFSVEFNKKIFKG
jgi:hypothetical protein